MDFIIIEATLHIFKPNLCVFEVMGGYVFTGCGWICFQCVGFLF